MLVKVTLAEIFMNMLRNNVLKFYQHCYEMNYINLQSIVHGDENIQIASIQYEKYIVDPRKKKEKSNGTNFYNV